METVAYVPAGSLFIDFELKFSYLLLDSCDRHLHYGIGAFWDRSLCYMAILPCAPVETSSSRIMPWHSVSPCNLHCPAATRGYGGSTPSYGLRFGFVGSFPTVVLSRSILAASLSHAVSVREGGHPWSRSSSDTGMRDTIFMSTCMTTGIFACRGVSGLDEDCSHVNILGHIIEKCLGVRRDDDVHYGRGHFVLYSDHMDTEQSSL